MESPYDKINRSFRKAGVKEAAKFTVPRSQAVPYGEPYRSASDRSRKVGAERGSTLSLSV